MSCLSGTLDPQTRNGFLKCVASAGFYPVPENENRTGVRLSGMTGWATESVDPHMSTYFFWQVYASGIIGVSMARPTGRASITFAQYQFLAIRLNLSCLWGIAMTLFRGISVTLLLVGLFIPTGVQCQVLCPDGSFVSRGPCTLCPNGSFVGGGGGCQLATNGQFVAQDRRNPRPPQMAPDGTFVSGGSGMTMCPDGSFVAGSRCVMAPNGRFVGK